MANALQVGKTNSVLLFGDYGTEVIRLSQLYDPEKDIYHPVGDGVAAGTAVAPVTDGSIKYFTYTQRRRTLTFSEVDSADLAPGTQFVGADGNFTELGRKSIWQATAEDLENSGTQVGHYVPVIKTLVVADTNDDKWGDNTLLLVVNVSDGTTENDKYYRELVDKATNSTNPTERANAQQELNEYVPMYKSTLEPINFSAGIENPTRAVDYSNDTFALYVEDIELKNIGNEPSQRVVTQKITLDRRLMMYGQARLRYVITRENDRSSTVICTNSVTTERQTAAGFVDFIPVDSGTSVSGITPDWFSDNVGKTVVYFNSVGVRCWSQIVLPPVPSGTDSAEQRLRDAIEECDLYKELLTSFNAGNQIYLHDHPDVGLAYLQMPDICYRRTNVSKLTAGEELSIRVYEYFVDAGSDYTTNIDDYRQVMSLHVTVKPASSLAQYDVARKNIVGFDVAHGDDVDTGDVWDVDLSNIVTTTGMDAIRQQVDAKLNINPYLKYDDGSYLKLDPRDTALRKYGLDELYALVSSSGGNLPEGFALDILFKYYPHLAFENRHNQLTQQSTRYSRVVMAKARLDNATTNIFKLTGSSGEISWDNKSGPGSWAATNQLNKNSQINRRFFTPSGDVRYQVVLENGNPSIELVNWHTAEDHTSGTDLPLRTPGFFGDQTEYDGSSGHEFSESDKQKAFGHIAGSGTFANSKVYSMQVEDAVYSITISLKAFNAITASQRSATIGVGMQFWSDVKGSGASRYLDFLGYKEVKSETIPNGDTKLVTMTFIVPVGTKYIVPVFLSYDYDTLMYVKDISVIRNAVVQYKSKISETTGRIETGNRVLVRRKDNRGNWLSATYGSNRYDAVYGYALATSPSDRETYLVKDADGNFVLAEGTGKLDEFLDDTYIIQVNGDLMVLDGPEYEDFNKGVETPYYIRTSSLTWDNLVNRPNRAFIAARKRIRITRSTPLTVRKIVPIPCWNESTQSYSFTYLVYKSDYKAPIILGSAPNVTGYVRTKNFPVVGAGDSDVADFYCGDPNKIYGLYPISEGSNAVELEYMPGLNATTAGGDAIKHLVYAFNALNSSDYPVKWLYAEPDGYDGITDGQITTSNINSVSVHVFGRAGGSFRRPYLECIRHTERGKVRYRYQVPYNASDTNYGFPDITTGSNPKNWFLEMFYTMAIFPTDIAWANNKTPTHFRVRHPTISGYASDPILISEHAGAMNYTNPIYCDTVILDKNREVVEYDFHLPIPTERLMSIAIVEFMRKIDGTDTYEYLMGVPVEVKLGQAET